MQALQLAELRNGHSIAEDNESDMYTMLVPAEEQKLYNDAKSNAVKLKYVLSARDYFTYDEELGPNSFAPQTNLTTDYEAFKDDERYTYTPLACHRCSGPVQDQAPISLLEKKTERFVVEKGQKEKGEQFQYSKAQLQVVKELIDAGLASVGTHYCEDCNDVDMHKPKDDDTYSEVITKLCLQCAVHHEWMYRCHNLVFLVTPQMVQTLLKKHEALEQKVTKEIGCIQFRTAEAQIDSLMYEILNLLPNKKKN